jgi:hypothetical protein
MKQTAALLALVIAMPFVAPTADAADRKRAPHVIHKRAEAPRQTPQAPRARSAAPAQRAAAPAARPTQRIHQNRPAAFDSRRQDRGDRQPPHRTGAQRPNMAGGIGSGPAFRTEAPVRQVQANNSGRQFSNDSHRRGGSFSRGDQGGHRSDTHRSDTHRANTQPFRDRDDHTRRTDAGRANTQPFRNRDGDRDRSGHGHSPDRGRHDHDDGRHNHHNYHNHHDHHNHHHHRHGHWHGDIRHFGWNDFHTWRHGAWHHGNHNGRFGWWWVVGPSWYHYTGPVYPYPNPYVPPSVVVVESSDASDYWFYCKEPEGYYPYVEQCYTDWVRVVAEPSQAPPAP